MKRDCSCWVHYPNETHKHKNGKWRCVDDYICVRDFIEGRNWDCCTHCVRKSNIERYKMGESYKSILNDMEEGIVVKAVVGDYVIYKKSWLDEHIDQEAVLWKSAKEFREKIEVKKGVLQELIKELKSSKGE